MRRRFTQFGRWPVLLWCGVVLWPGTLEQLLEQPVFALRSMLSPIHSCCVSPFSAPPDQLPPDQLPFKTPDLPLSRFRRVAVAYLCCGTCVYSSGINSCWCLPLPACSVCDVPRCIAWLSVAADGRNEGLVVVVVPAGVTDGILGFDSLPEPVPLTHYFIIILRARTQHSRSLLG